MLDNVPLLQQRTILQVVQFSDELGAKCRFRETLLVIGTKIGGVMQHQPQLLKLVFLNLLRGPPFGCMRKFLELAVSISEPQAARQASISKSRERLNRLRQPIIKAQKRI